MNSVTVSTSQNQVVPSEVSYAKKHICSCGGKIK